MQRFPLFVLTALAVLTIFAASGSAQMPLSLGSVTNFMRTPTGCPSGFDQHVICYSGTVQGCTNGGVTVLPIDFTYGVLGAGSTKGTIVFFNGSDGTDVGFNTDAQAYYGAGFQTIQVIWQTSGGGPSAWELAGVAAPDSIDSIRYAACRPATLLHWIRCGAGDGNYCMASVTNIYQGGGMCAEGASAGSAAIAYSMAEYEADNYLDNVEFMSGPPLSDISKGCAPNSSRPAVCAGTGHDSYCHNGGEGAWQDPTINYTSPADTAIDFWTGLIPANNPPPVACTTSNEGTDDSQFKAMSILDGESDSHFSYPNTSMTGWLCANSAPTNPVCANETYPVGNNSPAEGELFYTQVSANPLNVYRVDGCSSANSEDIEVPTSLVPALKKNGVCPTGQASLQHDMINACIPQPHPPRHR